MIGIFDSGIGGLTVARQIMKKLPNYQIIYFGDTARTPYGNKSKETIIRYSIEDTKFLLKNGAKIIVIACHTASAVAASALRKKFPDVPIFDVIKAGLIKAERISHGRIGIIGTRATIISKVHENFLKKINKDLKVNTAACPLLVPLVEEDWINRPETKKIIKCYLKPLKKAKIDTLILACTHYPLAKEAIKKAIKRKINIIDPGEEVAKEVDLFLKNHPIIEKRITKNKKHKFFVSDIPFKFEEFSQKFLGEKIKAKQAGTN